MEAPLAYWLSLVERLVQARIASVLDEHGVTRIQWRVLTILEEAPAPLATLQQSSEGLPPADEDETAESAVLELVESRWVSGDAEQFELTEHGSEALRRMSATVAELRASALEGISPEEEEVMIAGLRRIAENLDESH